VIELRLSDVMLRLHVTAAEIRHGVDVTAVTAGSLLVHLLL